MSDVAGGFSIDGLSKRNLFLIGVGIVVLFSAAGDMIDYGKKLFAKTPPTPICYSKFSRYAPGTKSLPPAGSPQTDARDTNTTFRVADAARICTAKNCDGAALANYRDALHGYLSARTTHMRWLDAEFGDAGLARARRLYSSPADLEIEQGLRERYQVKVFWINERSADEDTLRILLTRGTEALRPCRKGDVRG